MVMNEDLDFYCGLSRFNECQSCFSSAFSRKTLTIKTHRSELNKWFNKMNDNTIEPKTELFLSWGSLNGWLVQMILREIV